MPNPQGMSQEIGSIFDLCLAEKLQLVEDLWDDIGAAPSSVPLHEWQKAELDARKLQWQAAPASGVSWEAVKQRNDPGKWRR